MSRVVFAFSPNDIVNVHEFLLRVSSFPIAVAAYVFIAIKF